MKILKHKQHKLMILFIMILCFVFPIEAFAHVLRIQAITPFPQTVATASFHTATFLITNISPKVTVTVVDMSRFKKSSGLSIVSTNCGNPMSPGQNCLITLALHAPDFPTRITAHLNEWARPVSDFVRFPFIISVISAPKYTITPSAGSGGLINPNTPQVITQGGNLTFTATLEPHFKVKEWLVDGTVVQTGGINFTLNNIAANHTVHVQFAQKIAIAVGSTQGPISGNQSVPLAYRSSDEGKSWDLSNAPTLPASSVSGQLLGTSCHESACVTVGGTHTGAPKFNLLPVAYTSSDAGNHWTLAGTFPLPAGQLNGQSASVALIGNKSLAAGDSLGEIVNILPTIYKSSDSGNHWTETFTLSVNQAQGMLRKITCFNNFCAAVGLSFPLQFNNSLPIIYISHDGGTHWTFFSYTLRMPCGQVNGELNSIACVEQTQTCTAVGVSYRPDRSNKLPLAYISLDGGLHWTLSFDLPLPPGQAQGNLSDVSCVDHVCVAVGTSFDSNGRNFLPLVYTSSDAGKSWILSSPLPLSSGELSSITCDNETCIASGTSANKPIVLVSSDFGSNWNLSTPLPLPNGMTQGTLTAVTMTSE